MSEIATTTLGVVIAVLAIKRVVLLYEPLLQKVGILLRADRAEDCVFEVVPSVLLNCAEKVLLVTVAKPMAPSGFGPLARLPDVPLSVRRGMAVDVKRSLRRFTQPPLLMKKAPLRGLGSFGGFLVLLDWRVCRVAGRVTARLRDDVVVLVQHVELATEDSHVASGEVRHL